MNDSKEAINDPLISRDQGDETSYQIPVSSFANQEEQTNFRSKMQKSGFFSYVNILFTVSTLTKANRLSKNEQMLTDQDIPALGFNERTEQLEQRIMRNYEEIKRKKGRATIGQAAMKTFRKEAISCFLLDAIYKSLRVFLAWLLWKLLEVLTAKDSVLQDCFVWTGIMGGVLVFASYFEQHWMFLATQTGIRFRSALIKMVYSKLTKISVHSLNDLSIGKIVNVVANDVNIFERRTPFFSTVFLGIPTLIGGIFVLWNFFGPYCLAGIFYMIFSIPIQQCLIAASTKPQAQKNAVTDERVKLTNEMIDSIKLLKMYAWENIFADIVKKLRNKEVSLLKKGAAFEGIARGYAMSVTALSSYVIFVLYTYFEDKPLSISTVFPTLFLMGFLRIHVIFYTLNGFSFKAEVGLIFQRIQQILEAQEIGSKTFAAPVDPSNSVEFHDFNGYWSKLPEIQNLNEEAPVAREVQPAIAGIDLQLQKGSMNAIVGSVGAGKSSLLLAFTGEMPSTTGQLKFSGEVAYAEQEPTIFPGLLRDNILFGKGYRPVFYNEVVKACCLENDFKQLPQGDMTEIGEKGVNLSGGQKARIALARAIYSEADIYLLDDPLSAVDAKVAKQLYEDAILGMLKGKTVLLVTHQVHFVKDLASIIVMQDGRIVGQGNYAELKEQHVDVEGIFSTERTKNSRTSFGLESSLIAAVTNKQSITNSLLQNFRPMSIEEVEAEEEELENLKKNEDLQDEKAKLVAPEDPRSAKVTGRVYAQYVKAAGSCFFLFIVAIFFFGSVASDLIFARYIGLWARGVLDKPYMIIGILCAVIFLAYLAKCILYAMVVLNSSKNLHNKMLEKIVRNPPEFFDSNPVGRILNRFSNDVGVLDKALPIPQEDVLGISFAFIALIIAIAVINPKTLGPIFVGVIIIWLITRFCQEGVKQTKIYELTSRSPVYSLFSTTLAGLISIRSYGQVDQFQKSFSKLMNKNLKAGVSFTSNNQFLGISIDLTYTFISIATIIFLFLFKKPSDDQSLLGFSLCYILILNGMLQYNFRMMVQTKILMSSAARIISYCNSKSELPAVMNHDHELESQKWPQAGAIEFNNVKMKYREGADYVLKGVTFKARPGEKIGCVGRTGAGKSSIIQALFRMVEIERENSDSYIKIDGADTQQVGLELLRNSISIIPQIPVVFSGTIRRNLDPLGNYTDVELWKILEEVRLKEYVENIEKQLDADMSNSASMFSVGQKQLICLARAILKKSKIVVLDEATANVDTQTDNFIQQKIMERFANCTVFTIAHRLSTIANYDKVLVLDKGQVVEFDAPYKLLVKNDFDQFITNKSGHFASMVLNTGQRASYNIYKKAKAKYEHNHH